MMFDWVFRLTEKQLIEIGLQKGGYAATLARDMLLNKPRPRNISEADWRMALRRKLNGDTR